MGLSRSTLMRTAACMLMTLASANASSSQSRPAQGQAPSTPVAATPLDDLGSGPSDLDAPVTSADPNAMRGRIGYEIPSVMPPNAVRDYAQRMRLSEAQQQAIVVAYRAYCEAVERMYAEHRPKLVELNILASEHEGYDLEFLELLTPMRQRENQYVRELTAAEATFFAGLPPILAEEQVLLLEAAKLHRSRHRCYRGYFRLYEANIDLTEFVEDVRPNDDTQRDLEPVLLEYERAITPAWLEIDQVGRRDALEFVRLQVSGRNWTGNGPRPTPPTEEEQAQGRLRKEHFKKLKEEPVRLQQRLAELNWRYLPLVMQRLPDEKAEQLHHAFLRRAHPRIYPDPCDPIESYEQAVALLPADSDLRPAMAALWDSYRKAYMAETQKMIDHLRQWNVNMALTSGSDFANTRIVREARFERWAISERFVNQLIPLLPTEAQQALASSVGNFRTRLAEERAREANPRMANP